MGCSLVCFVCKMLYPSTLVSTFTQVVDSPRVRFVIYVVVSHDDEVEINHFCS